MNSSPDAARDYILEARHPAPIRRWPGMDQLSSRDRPQALAGLAFICMWLSCGAFLIAGDEPAGPKRIAAVVTEYRHNSHADVIVSRLFQTQTLPARADRTRI